MRSAPAGFSSALETTSPKLLAQSSKVCKPAFSNRDGRRYLCIIYSSVIELETGVPVATHYQLNECRYRANPLNPLVIRIRKRPKKKSSLWSFVLLVICSSEYDAKHVRNIYGVFPKTVEAWEAGTNILLGTTRRMLGCCGPKTPFLPLK